MKLSLFTCVMIGIAAGSLISACSGDRSSNQSHAETSEAKVAEPVFADEKTADLFNHYIQLKNSLVASDFGASKKNAKSLFESSASVPSIADLAKKVELAKDIAAQRSQFESLTAAVEKQIKGSKLSSGVIYKQYCPMANDGNGGYWLAKESEIRNPYYGDEMLQCGEVKEEIK